MRAKARQVPAALRQLRDEFVDLAGFDQWGRDYQARCEQDGGSQAERQARMHAVNPLYLLRNSLAQQAIEAAEQGRLEPLQQLYRVLCQPFSEQPGQAAYAARPPLSERRLALSCSS